MTTPTAIESKTTTKRFLYASLVEREVSIGPVTLPYVQRKTT